MPSLPTVGGDSGTWGTKLNDFLGVALNSDGTLKSTFSGVSFNVQVGGITLNNADYVTFGIQDFDTDNYQNGDSTPDIFVIPTTGKYLIDFWTYDASNQSSGMNCVKNRAGTPVNVIIATTGPDGGLQRSMGGSRVVSLSAGDTISFRYFGDNSNVMDAMAMSIIRVDILTGSYQADSSNNESIILATEVLE